jgi:two-component system alkaline phosphatase synthesis response regulator PhoP
MNKIYIVEDDENIREMLLYALHSAGFEAAGFAAGSSFFDALRKGAPDLLLLDIMLPGEDGVSILKKIRAGGEGADKRIAALPVIMLTAKGTEYDRIKGLNLGADDYVTKPFSVMEVISRIHAVLRRSSRQEDAGTSQHDVLTVGNITMDTQKRSVVGESEIDNLTYKEFELLRCLMLNEGIVLGREKILNLVWGQDYFGDTRTVDMHIKTLRQKLGAAGAQIKTVRNVGYKIVVSD